ncbi:MAG TPA: chemotaxis protein CheD [Bryobacteraceae bacterium]|nr:chemotaxis protein CheD [Bryobacteraceae bacterium]
MSSLVVGIADCKTSRDPRESLVTYALGSCVGLGVFDPQATVGGLLHVLLPEASLDAAKAAHNPCTFADTGLPVLLERCRVLGAAPARLRVWLAGGSSVLDQCGVFNIGKRNQLAMRKALWKAGLMIHAEDVGGSGSRTVRLDLATGTFWIRTTGAAEQELKAHAAGAYGGGQWR